MRATVYLAAALTLTAADAARAQGGRDSAAASVEHLRRVMDQFHNRFPVYDDVSSAGNHFHVYAKLPSADAAVTMNGSWTDNAHSGATAIRGVFEPSQPYGGFYFQNGTLSAGETTPRANWGTVPNAGINLAGATALTFWARGAAGGEQIEFFVGGVGRHAETGAPQEPFPDSSPRRPAVGTVTTLTTVWQQYTIDLDGADLSYVLGGFGWTASTARNPSGATFFLDDIQFELGPERRAARLNEPRFLRSYTTLPRQPDPFDDVDDGDLDFVLRNTAFTYDNALAILAFLADDLHLDANADSVRRARLIGDAFVYAIQHDRTFNDNRSCDDTIDPLSVNGARLRTAYAAGDIALPPGWTPNGRAATVPIPGFYVDATQRFYEVEQSAIDAGNNAWAVIALHGLAARTNNDAYMTAACKLARFIHAFRMESGTYRGFTGGVSTPESAPARRPWASSEHNLDAYAAFSRLLRTSGDLRWRDAAEHARQFVEAMWHNGRGCFLAGTTNPEARNEAAGQLPLDVQAWAVLALPDMLRIHPPVLNCALANHAVAADGVSGFDFNDDRDGVWLEGTAQYVAAFIFGEGSTTNYQAQLRVAQGAPAPIGDGLGLVAASHDGLSTGFLTEEGHPFKYFRRLHVGATAWNVFAQLEVNPYYLAMQWPSPATFEARFTAGAGTLTWSAVPGATGYLIERREASSAFTPIALSRFTTFTDTAVTSSRSYLYRLTTRGAGGAFGASGLPEPMTAIAFSDDPLVPGVIVKAAHMTELRTAVNAMRALAGLPPASFSSDSVVRAAHVTDLRTALTAARSALELTVPTWARPALEPGVSVIGAVDVAELRDGVR